VTQCYPKLMLLASKSLITQTLVCILAALAIRQNAYQPWAACTGTRCDEGGKPSKDGDHVQFQVVNIAGAKSWFYHSKFIEDKPMGEKGEFRSIVEIFKWIEPLPNLKRSQ